MLRIAVVSEEFFVSQVFLAALVQDTVNGIVKVKDKNVSVLISEDGREVAYGSDSIVISLLSSKKADSYSLAKALENPSSVPKGELGLAVRTSDSFFGRAHFMSVDVGEIKGISGFDSVLFIVDREVSDSMKEFVQKCVFEGIPITAAVNCTDEADIVSGGAASRIEELDKDMKLYPYVKNVCWYSARGFRDGERLSDEAAEPVGVQQLFWCLMRAASQKKTGDLAAEMRYFEKVIKRRASVFQAGSSRRVMELNYTRRAYSDNGMEMITAENMLGLAEEYFNKGGSENAT